MVAEIKTEIEIAQPPSVVWQVLMDFKSYPDWNDFMRSVSGEPRVGSSLEVSITPTKSSGMTFKPTVLECEENREFSWIGKLFFSGIFDGHHTFELSPLGTDKTLFRQSEKFSGFCVPLIMWSISADTEAGFKRMNQELKERCEQTQPAQPE